MDIDLTQIAKLAGLKLNAEELEAVRPRFKKMISYFEKLSEVDTSREDPLYHFQNEASLRKDEVRAGIADKVLQSATSHQLNERYFEVNRVVE
jgi:aspartyl-tRNA(Asn)/glutamyl-tRNA(Gln) amidotransferase subunit C